jgi:hypothetical protein
MFVLERDYKVDGIQKLHYFNKNGDFGQVMFSKKYKTFLEALKVARELGFIGIDDVTITNFKKSAWKIVKNLVDRGINLIKKFLKSEAFQSKWLIFVSYIKSTKIVDKIVSGKTFLTKERLRMAVGYVKHSNVGIAFGVVSGIVKMTPYKNRWVALVTRIKNKEWYKKIATYISVSKQNVAKVLPNSKK